MSIKSDNWIRRMAREHEMIEPFAAEQVRQVNGHKIVSYGTSSYGYDVRCASEFKIFTNINSTIVDPKNFDEKSFVDFGGDVCIIPPNSFALARTVEYFRIPRSVLTICLGKCVTGDTRVVDAETGAYVPITADALRQDDAGAGRLDAQARQGLGLRAAGQEAGVRAAHRDRSAHPRDRRTIPSARWKAGCRLKDLQPGRPHRGGANHPGIRQDADPGLGGESARADDL